MISIIMTFSIMIAQSGSLYSPDGIRSIAIDPDSLIAHETDSLVAELERLLSKSFRDVTVSSTQQSYSLNQFIHFEVKIPVDGYLNIIALEPNGEVHLLYPNKYTKNKNNFFTRGTIVHIPDDIGGFRLRAIKPLGNSVVYAFVSTYPVNLREKILYAQDLSPLDQDFLALTNKNVIGIKALDPKSIALESDKPSNQHGAMPPELHGAKLTIKITY